MAKTFGEVLREIRKSRDLSQRQVAIKYGVLQGKEYGASTSLIAGWESNSRNPSRESIALLSEALHVTPEEYNALLMSAGFLPKQGSTATIVSYALNGAEDLSPLAKEQLMEIVRDFAEKHKKQPEEENDKEK